ncbi:hypothetical protein [uncultured Corynebacterium sp.]|uniref:hypothetical protein n=1 Tax=uncultured Corynebacterium sp. TaxID=159447 RepID=UPI0025FCCB1B|nr:hypothetical protein [uncultured Corynebacterium sp.]
MSTHRTTYTAPTPVSFVNPGNHLTASAAVDPVTLRLALDRYGDDVVLPCEQPLCAPAILGGSVPQALASLADVRVSETSLSVLVDTGVLRWEEDSEPRRCTLTGYDGQGHYGVEVDGPQWWDTRSDLGRVADSAGDGDGAVRGLPDGGIVVCVPMTMADGTSVELWMTELDPEWHSSGEQPSGAPHGMDLFALLTTACELMRAARAGAFWKSGTAQSVKFPAQDISAAHDVHGLGVPTEQQCMLRISEEGARAVARAEIMLGLLPTSIAPTIVMGERAPVLLWFAQDGFDLPFCVSYSPAQAWLAPEATIDLDAPADW